jgi:antitoxin component YwqK of YwqJK toxin-antitoxin module
LKKKTLSKLFKYCLLFVAGIVNIKSATAQRTDTAVFYLKYASNGYPVVTTPDNADFMRIILPSDGTDENLNVMEYDKNRKLILVGKAEPGFPRTFTEGNVVLTGDCITYYSNGKRNTTSHYVHGNKEGMEYVYNYDGTIYCGLKHLSEGKGANNTVLKWECYDQKGNNICTDGNGWWLSYENSHIALQGAVKNGLPDGVWKGSTKVIDSIKYTYLYKDGKYISGIGYDKTGMAFPFVNDREQPSYNQNGPITFIRIMRDYFKRPKNFDAKKMNLDTAHFTFIVEKDNSISHIEFLGTADTALNNNLKAAFMKCRGWHTVKYYGVPFRLRIVFPYRESGGYLKQDTGVLDIYRREIDYKIGVLED